MHCNNRLNYPKTEEMDWILHIAPSVVGNDEVLQE